MQYFKNYLFSFLLFFSFSLFINAGDESRIGSIGYGNTLIIQGLNSQSLNSYGFSSGIASDLSSVANSNPASIYSKHKFSVASSYQYKTEIDDVLFNFGSKQSFYYLPQSASFLFSIEKFNAGIAYNQRYNHQWNVGSIFLTNEDDMDGESRKTFEPIWKQNVSAFSFITSYTLIGNENDKSFLNIGGKYSLNYLYILEKIPRSKATANIYTYHFSLGFHYKINPSIEVGAYYEHHTEFEGDVKIEGGNLLALTDPETDPDNPYQDFRPAEYKTMAKLPGKINTSLKYNFSENLFLTSDIYYIFWNYVEDNLKDAVEISSSITRQFSGKFRGSAGIYISDRKYKNDSDIFNGLYATYFTLGANYQFNFFTLQLALADSHLFSDNARKNTIGKIGIEYGF